MRWARRTAGPAWRGARAVLGQLSADPHLVIRPLSDPDHPATASGWWRAVRPALVMLWPTIMPVMRSRQRQALGHCLCDPRLKGAEGD